MLWAALILWGGGVGLSAGGILLFWKAKYQIDYQGNVLEVCHSWPKKQLHVNGELQDESTDFSFGRVDLRGRIKSGDATGHQIRAPFAPFGTSTPICVVIDDTVVFKG